MTDVLLTDENHVTNPCKNILKCSYLFFVLKTLLTGDVYKNVSNLISRIA